MRLAFSPCLLLIGLVAAAPAAAQPLYELTVSGTVNEIDVIPALQNDFDSTFSLGDPLTFQIVYDGGAPVTGGGGDSDNYSSAVTSTAMTIGSYTLAIPASVDQEIRLENPSFVGNEGDDFDISFFAEDANSQIGPDVGTAVPFLLGIFLIDTSGSIFPGTGDPPPLTTDFDFDAFDQRFGFFEFYDSVTFVDGITLRFEITGVTTRVVPEPSSIALLGLGGLLVLRRRHHAL